MGNVIDVDFKHKARTLPNRDWAEFVGRFRDILLNRGHNDFEIDGIMRAIDDPRVYEILPDNLKFVVDVYYNATRGLQ